MQKLPQSVSAESQLSESRLISGRFLGWVAATIAASCAVTSTVIKNTTDDISDRVAETGVIDISPSLIEIPTPPQEVKTPIQVPAPTPIPPSEVLPTVVPTPSPATSEDPEEPEEKTPETRVVTFSQADEIVLSRYSGRYALAEARHNHDTFNRTFPHRLVDHEILLKAIFDADNNDDSLVQFRELLFPESLHTPLFIDIGPGIANKDLAVGGGNGKPAITLQELAVAFPHIPFIALDLPSEVDIFLGKASKANAEYTIDANKRAAFLAHQNVHILSGDGLKPFKEQWSDETTNPIPDRARPQITSKTTLFVRAANSIDIYCTYKEVKPMLTALALDYQKNPICFFYNRQILLKPAGSLEWRAVGQTSNMGFRHSNRVLTRDGEPPFKFHASILQEVARRTQQRSNTAQREIIVPKVDEDEAIQPGG